MSEYKGMAYLKKKLSSKASRVNVRYDYYHMKNGLTDMGKMIPPSYNWMRPVLGWCAKAVDTLADRIVFDSFEDNTFYVNEIFDNNNRDVFFDSAILSALVSSCCFVYISADETGYPRLQCLTGTTISTPPLKPTSQPNRQRYIAEAMMLRSMTILHLILCLCLSYTALTLFVLSVTAGYQGRVWSLCRRL